MYGEKWRPRERKRETERKKGKGFVARFTTFGKRIGEYRVNSGRESGERRVYRSDRRKIVGDIDEDPCSRF